MNEDVRQSIQESKDSAKEAREHCLAIRALLRGRNGAG